MGEVTRFFETSILLPNGRKPISSNTEPNEASRLPLSAVWADRRFFPRLRRRFIEP